MNKINNPEIKPKDKNSNILFSIKKKELENEIEKIKNKIYWERIELIFGLIVLPIIIFLFFIIFSYFNFLKIDEKYNDFLALIPFSALFSFLYSTLRYFSFKKLKENLSLKEEYLIELIK